MSSYRVPSIWAARDLYAQDFEKLFNSERSFAATRPSFAIKSSWSRGVFAAMLDKTGSTENQKVLVQVAIDDFDAKTMKTLLAFIG
jgi:hypothetical protein